MDELPQRPYVVLIYTPDSLAFATRLKNNLQVYGITTWFHEGSLQRISRSELDEIANAMVFADAVIAVVSSDDALREPGHIFTGTILIDARAEYEKTFASLIQSLETRGLVTAIRIRINEEPLTAYNLSTILFTLTDLSTKYWLIVKGRFSDLIEYTQTHNGRFAEEANVVITKVSYNSPFNIDWKVDLSAPPVAEALVTTIDGITQRRERLEKAKLENQAKALEIKDAEQKAEQENQMALLEQEKLRLELEQRRLEVLEKQLEVQKKGIEYALEIAGRVVDTLHPSADPATRAMEIQTLLPNLIQLQSGRGLELAFPAKSESAQ